MKMNIWTNDFQYVLSEGTSNTPFASFSNVSSAQSGISVTPLDPSANANTTYRIVVDANIVPVNSTLYITLPPGVTMANISAVNPITGEKIDITSYVD